MNKKALSLLKSIERDIELAHKAYQRYSWQPHTSTGAADLERFEKRTAMHKAAISDLREMLTAATVSEGRIPE